MDYAEQTVMNITPKTTAGSSDPSGDPGRKAVGIEYARPSSAAKVEERWKNAPTECHDDATTQTMHQGLADHEVDGVISWPTTSKATGRITSNWPHGQ